MFSLRTTALAAGTLLLALPAACWPQFANITAIVGKHNGSAFECWQFTQPINLTAPGIGHAQAVQSLGAIGGNASLNLFSPGYNEGGHLNPPSAELLYFLTGLAHFNVSNGDTLDLVGGPFASIILADTKDTGTGHGFTAPGQVITESIHIPFANGTVPSHVVIHSGACYANETNLPGQLGLNTINSPS